MANLIIRPNSDESGALTIFGSATSHYSSVNESVTDDTNGVKGDPTGVESIDQLGLADLSLSGQITNVTVFARAWKDIVEIGGGVRLGVRAGATNYFSSSVFLTSDVAQYNAVWSVNPYTGVAWTLAGINSLSVLLGLQGQSNKTYHVTPYCSQLWVVVDYNASSTFIKQIMQSNFIPSFGGI